MIREIDAYLISWPEDMLTEDIILARKQFVYTLRTTPETQRCVGAIHYRDKVCALGLIGDNFTNINHMLGVEDACPIAWANDKRSKDYALVHTWSEIADAVERKLL